VEGLDQALQKWTIAANELKPALLLSGPALSSAENWLLSHEPMVSKPQKAFIFKSIMHRSAEQLIAKEQVFRAQRDKTIWWADFALSLSAVVLTIMFPILLKFAVVGVWESHVANVEQEKVAKAVAQAEVARHVVAAASEALAEPGLVAAGTPQAPPRNGAEEALASRSRYLAPLIGRALGDNDPTLALLLALEALPDEKTDDPAWRQRPLIPDVAAGLFRALRGEKPLAQWHQPDRVALSAAFCVDGARVLTATEEQRVRIWDVAAQKLLRVIADRAERMQAVAIDPACARFALAAPEHAVEIRGMLGAADVVVLRGHEGDVIAAAFDPAGKRLVTAAQDGTARLWDAMTGHTLHVLSEHAGIVRTAEFSPDGRLVLTASEDKTARLWDAASGRPVQVFRGHEGTVTSASFSPDARRIVTTSYDGSAAIWTTLTGERTATLRPTKASVLGASFDSAGRRVLTTAQGKAAQLWDAQTGDLLGELDSHGEQVRNARFSPDGAWIVITAWNGEARLWSTAPLAQVAALNGGKDHIEEFAFREQGRILVAITSAGSVLEWPLRPSLQAIVHHAKESVPTCLAPAQRQLYALDSAPPAWCLAQRKPPYDRATIEGALDIDARSGTPEIGR